MRKDWEVVKKTKNKTKQKSSKNFQPPSFFVHRWVWENALSSHNVHCNSGGHCVKADAGKGGLDIRCSDVIPDGS